MYIIENNVQYAMAFIKSVKLDINKGQEQGVYPKETPIGYASIGNHLNENRALHCKPI